jgi:hypothetical protein
MQTGFKHALAILGLVTLAFCAQGAGPNDSQTAGARKPDMVERVNRFLSLSASQKAAVDPIVLRHEQRIGEIRRDSSLSRGEKALAIRTNVESMVAEIKPYLTGDQVDELDDAFESILKPGPHAKIAVEYSDFFPVDAEMRSIFGNSLASYGIGLGGDERPGKRTRFGFGVDLFDTASSPNTLFVLSPQESFEYRVPVLKSTYLFGIVSAGPSYMDYTFDTPGGQHFAAKRLGLDGSLEVGLQWGPVRLGVQYRAFTQPADLNFNGIEATLAVTVFKF